MKKAFCVGINTYPQEGQNLKGCVNDAHAWASLLNEHYDFAKADIEVLLDQKATHDAIVGGLKSLLAGASPGDVLVFTNSSHGTYLADTDGDEKLYDEALCPFDTDTKPLVDDTLRELFTAVPAGVRLSVISDSCHSGTVTRVMWKPRFLDPKLIGMPTIAKLQQATPRSRAAGGSASDGDGAFPQSDMRDVLLSGCRHNQYSYDAAFENKPQGAFTYFALAAIREANYKITYNQVRQRALAALKQHNFDQEPQVEGNTANRRRQIFT